MGAIKVLHIFLFLLIASILARPISILPPLISSPPSSSLPPPSLMSSPPPQESSPPPQSTVEESSMSIASTQSEISLSVTQPTTIKLLISTPPISSLPTGTPPNSSPIGTSPITSLPTETPPITSPNGTSPITSLPTETPPITTSPIGTPPITTSPIGTPSITTSTIGTPPITTSPIGTPPITTSPITTLPIGTPPILSSPIWTPPISTSPIAKPPNFSIPISSSTIGTPITIPTILTQPILTPLIMSKPSLYSTINSPQLFSLLAKSSPEVTRRILQKSVEALDAKHFVTPNNVLPQLFHLGRVQEVGPPNQVPTFEPPRGYNPMVPSGYAVMNFQAPVLKSSQKIRPTPSYLLALESYLLTYTTTTPGNPVFNVDTPSFSFTVQNLPAPQNYSLSYTFDWRIVEPTPVTKPPLMVLISPPVMMMLSPEAPTTVSTTLSTTVLPTALPLLITTVPSVGSFYLTVPPWMQTKPSPQMAQIPPTQPAPSPVIIASMNLTTSILPTPFDITLTIHNVPQTTYMALPQPNATASTHSPSTVYTSTSIQPVTLTTKQSSAATPTSTTSTTFLPTTFPETLPPAGVTLPETILTTYSVPLLPDTFTPSDVFTTELLQTQTEEQTTIHNAPVHERGRDNSHIQKAHHRRPSLFQPHRLHRLKFSTLHTTTTQTTYNPPPTPAKYFTFHSKDTFFPVTITDEIDFFQPTKKSKKKKKEKKSKSFRFRMTTSKILSALRSDLDYTEFSDMRFRDE